MGEARKTQRNRSLRRGRQAAAQPAHGMAARAAPTGIRDAQAARRAFEALLFDDGKEHLAEFRSAAGWGTPHDLCEVRIWIPLIRDGEVTPDNEDLFVRPVSGPRGMIEQLVQRVNAVCDALDPAGALLTDGTENPAPCEQAEPVRPATESDSSAATKEGRSAAEGACAEPNKVPDARGGDRGDDMPEAPPAVRTETEPDGDSLPTVRELLDRPWNGDPMAFFSDTPGSDPPEAQEIGVATLLALRRIEDDLTVARRGLERSGADFELVEDDVGVDRALGLGGVAAAMEQLGALRVLVCAWVRRVNFGPVIELRAAGAGLLAALHARTLGACPDLVAAGLGLLAKHADAKGLVQQACEQRCPRTCAPVRRDNAKD